MLHKLTINVSDEVYEGLQRVVGRGRISKFMDNLARPHVTKVKPLSAREVAGCVPYNGPAPTPKQEREAVRAMIRAKWARKVR